MSDDGDGRWTRRLGTAAFWLVLVGTAAGVVAQWAMLWLQLPWLERLEGWFWPFMPEPASMHWTVPLALSSAAALLGVWLLRHKPAAAVVVLCVFGFALQHGFARMDGVGLDGLRDHLTQLGHQTFTDAAVRVDGDLSWVADYEGTLQRYDRLGHNARSKPPGTLLLYVASERAANLGHFDDGFLDRKARAVTLMAWTWPALCFVVLIPIAILGERFGGRGVGLIACALYVVVPSVQLITAHADQAFMPTFAILPVLAAMVGVQRRSIGWALASGGLLYVALFFGFSMVGVPMVLGAGALAVAAGRDGERSLLQDGFVALGGLIIGFALCDAAGSLLLNYDALARFRSAMDYHHSFKRWDDRTDTQLWFAYLNTLEWFHWVGLPVVVLWLAAAGRAVGRWARPKPIDGLSIGLLVTFAVIALMGATKGETARLWLWFVPFACLAGAQLLMHQPEHRRRWLVPTVLVAQWVTVWLMKVRQDFGNGPG